MLALNAKKKNWKDASMVKNASCSFRRSEFNSQHPCWGTHNHLKLPLRRSNSTFWPPWTLFLDIDSYTDTAYTQLKTKLFF